MITEYVLKMTTWSTQVENGLLKNVRQLTYKGILFKTKDRLLYSMAFLIAKYRSNSWIRKSSNRKTPSSFELWCNTRMLRVS